ncbi:FAD-binding protein [Bacillus cereus]|nr:FAD-binding protein [Bacillus cereus]
MVGSGLAGSAATIFCAQRGLRIIIIDGVTRKVDELGRVVILKELRNTLGIKEKSPLDIFVEGEDIVL